MTLAEYTRLTDLRAVRTARHAIHDIIDHQPDARRKLCQSIINAFDAWITDLQASGRAVEGKETPFDAGKPES